MTAESAFHFDWIATFKAHNWTSGLSFTLKVKPKWCESPSHFNWIVTFLCKPTWWNAFIGIRVIKRSRLILVVGFICVQKNILNNFAELSAELKIHRKLSFVLTILFPFHNFIVFPFDNSFSSFDRTIRQCIPEWRIKWLREKSCLLMSVVLQCIFFCSTTPEA